MPRQWATRHEVGRATRAPGSRGCNRFVRVAPLVQGREAFGRTELLALACLLVALSVIGWSVSTFRREAFRTVDSWVQHIAAIYAPM